jgi:hypothetical protein
LLADYEEGTWSPTLLTTSTNFTSVTYHPDDKGTYTKIGNVVYVYGVIRTSAIVVGAASGNLQIGGLPFTCNATYNGSLQGSYMSGWVTNQPSFALVNNSATNADLFYRSTSNGNSNSMGFAEANTGLGNNFFFSGMYFT